MAAATVTRRSKALPAAERSIPDGSRAGRPAIPAPLPISPAQLRRFQSDVPLNCSYSNDKDLRDAIYRSLLALERSYGLLLGNHWAVVVHEEAVGKDGFRSAIERLKDLYWLHRQQVTPETTAGDQTRWR